MSLDLDDFRAVDTRPIRVIEEGETVPIASYDVHRDPTRASAFILSPRPGPERLIVSGSHLCRLAVDPAYALMKDGELWP